MWNSEKNRPYLQLVQGEGTKFDKARFTTTTELKFVKTPPRIEFIFNHRAMEKLRALTKECDIEIGALGIVSQLPSFGETLVYKVYDIFVPEQECSPTVTRMTTDGLVNLLRELEEAWAPVLGADAGWDRAVAIKDQLNYWWHSHVNMMTTPSGQDEREFTTQATNRKFFFMSIGNKRGDLHVNVKMAVEGLPTNFAQWEIRDISWRKEWETMICVKDEVHPLLLKPGESPYRVRMYEDKGAGELLVDPDIEAWAREQVRLKVKSGFGNLTRWASNDRSTVIVPGDLTVKEFYVEKDTDLEKFVIQYFGPQPEYKEVPKIYTPPPVASGASRSDVTPHDRSLDADPIPSGNGSGKSRSTPIPVQVYPPISAHRAWWQFPEAVRMVIFPSFDKSCLLALLVLGYYLAVSWWFIALAWLLICLPTGIGRGMVYLLYYMWVQDVPRWAKQFSYFVKGRRSGWTDADEQALREERKRAKMEKQNTKNAPPPPPRSQGKPLDLGNSNGTDAKETEKPK